MAAIIARREILLDGSAPVAVSVTPGSAHRLGIGAENIGAAALTAFKLSGRVGDTAPWQQIAAVSGDYQPGAIVAWSRGNPVTLAAGASAAVAVEIGWFSQLQVEVNAASATTVVVSFFGS